MKYRIYQEDEGTWTPQVLNCFIIFGWRCPFFARWENLADPYKSYDDALVQLKKMSARLESMEAIRANRKILHFEGEVK